VQNALHSILTTFSQTTVARRQSPDDSRRGGDKETHIGAHFWFVSLHFHSLLSFTCIAADCTQIKKLNRHRNSAQFRCRRRLWNRKPKRPVVETKIVNTKSGNPNLFAAVRNRNALLAVRSYAQRSHVAQPCSSSRERVSCARCLSFRVLQGRLYSLLNSAASEPGQL
jgi:hypothetical protein